MKSVLVTIILFCFVSVQAQFRSYSNEFLNIGVDAQAFGMGNAVVAKSGDVNSAYWNPAGLAKIRNDWQASAMHAEYFQSIAKYDYAAFAIPLENRNVLAISAFRFGVDNILNTTELIDSQGNIDYDRITTFSAADYALQLSYAGYFFNLDEVSFGANAKLIYRNVGEFANAIGFGFDAGMQYTKGDFSLGIMARDITTTFNAWNVNTEKLKQITVDSITLNNAPKETMELTLPKVQLGVSQKIDIYPKFTLTGEFDLNFRLRENNDLVSAQGLSFSPSAGMEAAYDEMVFLRVGVNNIQRTKDFKDEPEIKFQPNAGVGFKYRGFSVDYALTNIGGKGVGLYSNIFSIKFDLGEYY